ncbi:hypothetical protein [Pedobacter sp. Hv1]|uniref:hypothetical protein n=1 Tax=Pedobacter sp. Hv1 TaxID=1740090 RepID=UPI0006D8B2B1|nr:hypothetical protein [Pedobacter sp. Hv1]KQB98826.1 hypothetical protein AQF98_21015 [Pedobacter sp. Hv1]
MKKLILSLLISLFSITLWAQAPEKVDVILKVNGDEMKGKITKINDVDLTFIYSGETLEYTIKKSDILKIVHASGRVEVINQPTLPSESRKNDRVVMNGSPADHHNKIAILPFHFLIDHQAGAEEVGYKAQQDTYAFLSQHSAGYTILNPMTTNALLIKAGVTKDKMMGFTMDEICNILGVEYVIDGTITQNKGVQTSSTSDNANTTIKKKDDKNVVGVKSSEYAYANSAQRYDVAVNLNIYTDTNASIYSQNHKAFFSSTDASYSAPLEYLLKRCPLYRK